MNQLLQFLLRYYNLLPGFLRDTAEFIDKHIDLLERVGPVFLVLVGVMIGLVVSITPSKRQMI